MAGWRASHGVCALLGLLVATSCADKVTIGAVISETGAAAIYGQQVRRGIEVALEEINAEGGIDGKPVEIVFRDDATNPTVGQRIVGELIEQHRVPVIIGAVSSTVTLAIAPICEKAGVVLLSPTASAPELTQAGDYIYRNYPSDILEGTAMADFARDLGLRHVAVLAVDNAFGRGLESVFVEKYQGKYRKVSGPLRFPESRQESFDAVVQETAREKVDGIYIVAYLADAAELIRRIRSAGVRAVILAASSVTDAGLVGLAGEAAENVIFPRPGAFDPAADAPPVRRFVEAYRAKYGEDPQAFAAYGYDALKLIRLAAQQGGSIHPKDVRLGLRSITGYEGASGRVAFDEYGDVIQYPRLFIIRRGRAVPYERFIEEGGTLEIPRRD